MVDINGPENQSEPETSRISNYEYRPGIVENLLISLVRPSYVPIRPATSEIVLLAQSIKEKGLLQPIIVRPKEDYFEVIAGNRRYNACKLLGWRKISCYILELDDKEAYEISLIENLQRSMMDPLEEAEAYRKYVLEFGWGSISDLAKRIGKSVTHVSKRISLLELPQNVLMQIKQGEIKPSIAEELLYVKYPEEQSRLAQLVSERHISMRKLRALVVSEGYIDHTRGLQDELDAIKSSNNDLILRKVEKAYDKSIIALKLALANLATSMEEVEDDWLAYEMLLQNKHILHSQIDLLLKWKKIRANLPIVF